jgi:hypothetical protein
MEAKNPQSEAKAVPPMADKPKSPEGSPTTPAVAEVGVVLRRQTNQAAAQDRSAAPAAPWRGRTIDWGLASIPPSNVAKTDKGPAPRQGASATNPTSRNVAKTDVPSRLLDRSVDFGTRSLQPGSNQGRGGPRASQEDEVGNIDVFSNVDNVDMFSELPAATYLEEAIPTRLRGPEAYATKGRTGPASDVVQIARAARKQQLLDRAKSRGRDPNAGAVDAENGYTRSADTQEQYLARGRNFIKRYRKERGILQDDLLNLDPIEFADWILSLKPSIKPTTWRPYRQSAKAVLENWPHDNADIAIANLDADVVESGSEPARKPKPGDENKRNLLRKTSASKAKSIPKADFDRLLAYLRHFSTSKYAPILADWMVAGLATGIRPKEWMATSLEIVEEDGSEERSVWLYVLNAKATNGRANGAVRTLDLSGMRDETVSAIRRMSERGRDWLVQGTYKEMQGQCSQVMYNTCERLFRGRKFAYALYTLRHQFIANAKSYHTPGTISAMAGHGVENTATENYGKKRSAWNPEDIQDRADAAAEEVAMVKRRHLFYEDRQKLKAAAGLIRAPRMGQGGDD